MNVTSCYKYNIVAKRYVVYCIFCILCHKAIFVLIFNTHTYRFDNHFSSAQSSLHMLKELAFNTSSLWIKTQSHKFSWDVLSV